MSISITVMAPLVSSLETRTSYRPPSIQNARPSPRLRTTLSGMSWPLLIGCPVVRPEGPVWTRPGRQVAAADDALVHPRELLTPIVEALLEDLPGGQIDRPAIERGAALVGPVVVGREHLRMANDVEHDAAPAVAVVVVVGVERVVHVAG